jgi:ribonuclease-3
LEFLGDGVLEIIAATHCFEEHPFSDEGKLTSSKVAIVRNSNIAKVARQLGKKIVRSILKKLGMDTVLLVPPEHGSFSEDMMANTFEAFLAALYLDQGLLAASQFCAKHLLKIDKDVSVLGKLKINKTALGRLIYKINFLL